jgi:hydroxymethylbilane synthase
LQSHDPFLRIGTRGSALALAQAELVRARIALASQVPESEIELVVFTTSGDRLTDRPLSEAGGKGLFTKEIDQALLDGTIDLGVHSSKDVASVLPEGMVLSAFLEREDIRDAFISLRYESLDALPEGARFGTSSIRRAAQISRRRPDLQIVPFRGNVQTRLRKLEDGVADATLLAAAGLNRLGEAQRVTAYLDPEAFPPAPAQGAIGIATREEDARVRAIVAPLDHLDTHTVILAERGLLKTLDGSCRTPVGVFTRLERETISLKGEILDFSGGRSVQAELSGPSDEAEAVGQALGRELVSRAGPDLIAQGLGR